MRAPRTQAGFSLLEALIAVALFALVVLGLVSTFRSNSSALVRGQTKLEIQQNARSALESLSRELRMAGYDPSGAIPQQDTATAIQSASHSRLSFIADVDSDDVAERVTFRSAGDTFVRDVAVWNDDEFDDPVSSVLAEGIHELHFDFFDADEGVIATPVQEDRLGEIRRLEVRLSAVRISREGWKATYPLRLDVQVRNGD